MRFMPMHHPAMEGEGVARPRRAPPPHPLATGEGARGRLDCASHLSPQAARRARSRLVSLSHGAHRSLVGRTRVSPGPTTSLVGCTTPTLADIGDALSLPPSIPLPLRHHSAAGCRGPSGRLGCTRGRTALAARGRTASAAGCRLLLSPQRGRNAVGAHARCSASAAGCTASARSPYPRF